VRVQNEAFFQNNNTLSIMSYLTQSLNKNSSYLSLKFNIGRALQIRPSSILLFDKLSYDLITIAKSREVIWVNYSHALITLNKINS